tara:strand:+ start:1116 stop:2213 length:1098 start_codon:yes stop_codon:yes gene_type:complete
MSELKTNQIATNDSNNVAIDNSLNLKSYTTTQRDALTSAAGDMIYNTTTSKVEHYNGSAWQSGTDITTFTVDFLVLGPGGGGGGGEPHTGGDQGGGGGAGRYRTSYGSGDISGGLSAVESALTINKGVPIPVSIGAGGTGGTGSGVRGGNGSDTYFYNIFSISGGGGGSEEGYDDVPGKDGGSGGGQGKRNGVHSDSAYITTGQPFYTGYGFRGGYSIGGSRGGSAGGGAGAVGTNGGNTSAPGGGAGIDSSITGSAVGRGGGGGGGGLNGSVVTSSDGGGNGGNNSTVATAGAANKGGGGGGGSCQSIGSASVGAAGGSGVVIIRYATSDVSSYSQTGLTISSSTDGSDTVLEITAGTGTITFS